MNKNKNTKIILFSKAPIVNQVKTRLARFTGSLEAVKLYEAFLKDTLVLVDNVIDSCGDDNKIEKYIYYFPKKAFAYFKALANDSWKLLFKKFWLETVDRVRTNLLSLNEDIFISELSF